MNAPDATAEERAVLHAAQLADVITEQAGVVTRAQLVRGGVGKQEIRRRTRRRELVRVHPRVYVTHTGPLTWEQRAWAAVLYAGPGAALCAESLDASRRDAAPIHVAIDQRRRVVPVAGVVLHRVTGLSQQTLPGSRPPRLRLEDNALMTASAASTELDVIAALGAPLGRRTISAGMLAAALARHPRMRHRRFIAAVIDDLSAGACSVLEHAYLLRVERAHGLPTATRQALRVASDGLQYRDVAYETFGLVVELDGRLGHDSWEGRGRDADRDLDDLALNGDVTARLRWHQVFGTPCRTADRIARVLQRRGWEGRPRHCGPDCTLPERET
jgi:hypothetical protein